MTGPPYPHPVHQPGSNAIGSFEIGVSPIGLIPTFDFWTTVISQYANSPILDALIQSFNDALDMTENLENFFDFIWNVQTAQGYGLDVWGRIVGVGRAIHVPSAAPQFFGFNEAGSWLGWNQAPFYSGGAVTTNTVLGDADFRLLILAKAASNICDGSIPGINAVLLALFPKRGDVYVEDLGNMTMAYKFTFVLTSTELAIVLGSGILPKPVGVAASVIQPSGSPSPDVPVPPGGP